ncbi:SDR family NAD(P)-dependent oxidoreductase [Streptomyces sp. NPDC091219]|uniref:SDR family NAD(P)-dependent oxidoreductase n=1 Tax=Streptomyces sp. NPDC091219 TaxID=3155193 RepID=UPI00344C5BCC
MSGPVAVVVGAATPIGREVARLLKEDGVPLMLTDINADHLTVVAAEMGQTGCAVATRVLDVTEPEAWVRLFQHVEATMGPVQILVNAADFDPGHAVVGMSAGDWVPTVAINLSGVVYGLAALAPRIQSRPLPVSIMTTAGQRTEDGSHAPSYVARRAALAIADRWAGELAADGVHVVASHIPASDPGAVPALVRRALQPFDRRRPLAGSHALKPADS